MHQHSSPPAQATPRTRPAIRVLRFCLPLLVLLIGGGITYWLLETGPEAKPRRPEPRATLVEVRPVAFGPARVTIEAMGTVTATRKVELRPQVSGEVVEISEQLVPGGLFEAGQVLLKIDPADYELAVQQLAGEVAQAEADLRVELGNREVARQEYELLGATVGEEALDLVLRQPQLAAARARLETVRAKLARARLDLKRTEVRAPFNCVVQSRPVNLGARVSENTPLATLVGSDLYWVEVLVPVRNLKWIGLPESGESEGALVRIYDQSVRGGDDHRKGRVVKLAADLEEQGRLARLLVEVEDPLQIGENKPSGRRLFLGSYVRVEIEGRPLAEVARLERGLLREGEQVWVMGPDQRLEIRPVEIVYRGRNEVFIKGGLKTGERLIVTDLAAPVPGMPLRTRAAAGNSDSPATPALRPGGDG